MTWFRHLGIAIMMPILAAVGIANAHAQERFDYEVREQMFRAFGAPPLIHSTSPGLTAGPINCRPFRPGP